MRSAAVLLSKLRSTPEGRAAPRRARRCVREVARHHGRRTLRTHPPSAARVHAAACIHRRAVARRRPVRRETMFGFAGMALH
jgi:hypothetical protein